MTQMKQPNNKALISCAKAIADIVGCHPTQVSALVQHDRYKFPAPCRVVRHHGRTIRYYRLHEVIDYKQVYQDLLKSGVAKQYREKDKSAEKTAELAVEFYGGNPSALAKFGRAVLSFEKLSKGN